MQTSKNVKKSLTQNRIPRISTRGFYDLTSGRTLKKKPYAVYPKRFFNDLGKFHELTIMIHGLRNNKQGALAKFTMAQKRLKQLGYKYPVIGFSYDSNTKGVQYKSTEAKATNVGRTIARKNGYNLAQFVLDLKKQHPDTKIRLIGHSLGTEVILSTIHRLKKKNLVESVYLFGSSIPADSFSVRKFGRVAQNVVREKICNYYSTHDEVLKYGFESGIIQKPLGYSGTQGKTIPKYVQKHVHPKNHRFASYAAVLRSFP
jgi:pimeloyl-ACP methyl ester carboxylesterase